MGLNPHQSVDAVEVRAWGKLVGAVAREPTKNYYAFQYAPEWVRSGIELAPLQMPLAQAREPFIFTVLPEPTFKRLPALLADALPDDFGNALIDAWITDKGIAKDAITSLDRLASWASAAWAPSPSGFVHRRNKFSWPDGCNMSSAAPHPPPTCPTVNTPLCAPTPRMKDP